MNMTLSLLNAAALVALVAFHFQAEDDGGKVESVAVQAQPHYLMKQSPRYAAMTADRSDAVLAKDANPDGAIPVERTERWVF